MYPVSNDYINKLTNISKKERRIRGFVDNIAFTENDILEGSFSYTDIAVKSADIKLGGVFVGSLSLTFLKSFMESSGIARGSWREKVISFSIGLKVGNTWVDIPMKSYTIDEANHSALGVDIVAYDMMSKFDASISMSTTTGKIYDLASLACQTCNVTLGMTELEMGALPNGEYVLSIHENSDIETWRDLISWIAVTIGGFATINRDNSLVFRNWHTTADIEIDRNNRFTGGSWSDFETNYTAIKTTNMEDGSVWYDAIAQDTGLTLDIGANPLIQYGIEAVKQTQRQNILNAVQNLKYVPFKSTSLIDPCLDLGDVISYTDGIANNSLCCVMRIDFKYNKGVTLQGYGKNPSLNGARSAQDKAIAAAAGSNKANELTYYTFINAEAKTIGTSEAQLFTPIRFSTAQRTTVEWWYEAKLLADLDGASSQSLTLAYYLDGELQDYDPVDTWSVDGYHMVRLGGWFENVAPSTPHTFEVRALVDGGEVSLGIGDLHVMLKGQAMNAQDSFDGLITCVDDISPYLLGRLIASIEESAVSLATQTPIPITLNDTTYTYSLGRLIASMSEGSVDITMAFVQMALISEDEAFAFVDESETMAILSEDGT